MKNRTQITYLALTEREIELLRNILSVVPQFAGKCDFVEPGEARDCHVVVVNTDDPLAPRSWDTIRKRNKAAIPLTLSYRSKQRSELQLKRPVEAKSLIAAMDGLISVKNVAVQGAGASDVLNILVVDDSYTIRKHMEYTIPKIDNALIDMNFASSGEDALEQISGKTFDLVFLDIVMPGINGYNVCKAMKADGIASVVMLTSKKSSFDKVRGLMAGCDGYITKPPTLTQLREQIAKCKSKREDIRRARIARNEDIVPDVAAREGARYVN